MMSYRARLLIALVQMLSTRLVQATDLEPHSTNILKRIEDKIDLHVHNKPMGEGRQMDVGRKLQLLFSVGLNCVWNSVLKNCEMDYSNAAKVFSTSKDDFAQYMSKDFNCRGKHTEDDCFDEDVCGWNAKSEVCGFRDYAKDHEDSPCVTAAPAHFEFVAAVVACQKQQTSSACKATDNCTWRTDDTCVADIFPIYFNIESIDAFFDEIFTVAAPKIDDLVDAFSSAYDISSRSFEWEDVLDWEVPSTDCPKIAETKICDATDSYLEIYAPYLFYCGGKYGSYDKLGCANDEYCEYSDRSDQCSLSGVVFSEAVTSAINALILSMSNKVDSVLLSAFLTCPEVSDEDKCSGECEWIKSTEQCISNSTYINHILTKPAKTKNGKSDPVCKYLLLGSDNECTKIQAPLVCEENDRCYWSSSNGCSMSYQGYIEVAAEHAKDLDESDTDLYEPCYRYRSKSTCEGV